MPDEHTEEERAIREAEKYLGETPRIVVCGKTGAGKSSLINALLEREVNRVGHSEPTTQAEQEEAWSIGTQSLRILDVPGFGEADRHQDRLEFLFHQLSTSHIGLLVIGAPDRAWEYERQFVRSVKEADPSFPMIVVGNRIDMFNPVREWNPATLDLTTPRTGKEQAICTWAASLREACGVDAEHLVLTSAGESFRDREGRYGLKELAATCVRNLPAACQNACARALRVDIDKQALAEKIIYGAAVAAAAVALTPIPLADCIPLAGIQIAMIIRIADIYDRVLTRETAFHLLSPAIASFTGRIVLAGLLDFFPGIGTVAGALLGAGIAGPMTFAIGKTYLEFFARDNFRPNAEEVRDLLKKNYSEARKQAGTLEEEARRKRAEQ